MIDKRSLEKMCEHEYSVSLIGEIEPVKETARERANRIWGMMEVNEQIGFGEANDKR
jgi:hypothetical protein